MDFSMPAVSPRIAHLDAAPHLNDISGEGAWVGFGDSNVGLFGEPELTCDVGTVKINFPHKDTNNSGSHFALWLPLDKFSFDRSYQQGPYCRCELIYPRLKPRPCFRIKVTFTPNGEEDMVNGIIDARSISDSSNSAMTLSACFKLNKSKVISVIKQDKLFESTSHFDERELLDAAFKGIPERVKACLDRWDDVNVANENLETPLHKAVTNGSEEVVKMLVERGADPRISDKFGQTPVDIAEKFFKKDLVPLLRTYQ
jgi:hypothetical protein